MTVSFEGIGENAITFYNAASSGAAAHWPVKLSAGSTVCKADDGGRFMGVCLSADGGFAAVATEGYINLTYTGTAPTVGYCRLVAAADGSVKVDSAATPVGGEYLVLDVDTTAKTVGFIL